MPEMPFAIKEEENFDPALERLTFPALRALYRRLGTPDIPAAEDRPFALTARRGTRAIGFLLGCAEGGQPGLFRIHSVYVSPPMRQKGVATALWEKAEAYCREQGGTRLMVNYVVGKPAIAHLEKILARQGWSEPQQSMLVIKTHMELAVQAPWYKEWALPENYRIASWGEATEEEKEEILSSHAEERWIAEDLIPFRYLPDHHPETSLALYREGRIRGWLINHLVQGVVRYTCSFVHPELQRKGRVFVLYSEAMRRMQALGLDQGMWTVPTRHPAMQAFAKRWMQPYSTSFTESRDALKELSGSV